MRDPDASNSFWIGLLLGVSLWVKYLNGIFLLIYLPFVFKRGRRPLLLFLLGYGIAIIPLLVYHRMTFGSFFRTGYSFWIPDLLKQGVFFSPRYAFQGPLIPYGDARPLLLSYLLFLLGFVSNWRETPHPFFFFPFIFIGAWTILKYRRDHREREFLYFTFWSVIVLYLFSSFQCGRSPRFMIGGTPYLFIVGSIGIEKFLRRLRWIGKGKQTILILLGCFLLIMLLSPFDFYTTDVYKKRDRELIRNHTEDHASILSDLDAVSFAHYFQRDSHRRYLPISNTLEYVRRVPTWGRFPYLPFEDPAHLEALARSRDPLYITSTTCQNFPFECETLRGNFSFREVASLKEIRLYRLESY